MNNLTLDTLKNLDYPVKIEFDPEEELYTADFPDLPGCSADGASVEEAYRRAVEAKNEWLKLTVDQGLQVPPPSKTTDYSGRILVRIPTSLHASLADRAKIYQSSLNQYIVYLLSGSSASDIVERRLDTIQTQLLGCEHRISILAGCVQHLGAYFMRSASNGPMNVSDSWGSEPKQLLAPTGQIGSLLQQ